MSLRLAAGRWPTSFPRERGALAARRRTVAGQAISGDEQAGRSGLATHADIIGELRETRYRFTGVALKRIVKINYLNRDMTYQRAFQ